MVGWSPFCGRLLVFVATLIHFVSASSYDDEKRLVQQLYNNMGKDELTSVITACQHGLAGTDASECRRTEYVKRVKDQIAMLSAVPHSAVHKHVSTVPRVDESYQSLFENYIVENKPYKGILMNNESLFNLMLRAGYACTEHHQPWSHALGDIPLRDCPNINDLRDVVIIPPVAANSYNVRLDLGSAESDLEAKSGFINYATHWPSLISIPSTQDVSLPHASPRSCPANMHMLLWGASEHLTARLFPLDVTAYKLSPTPGSHALHEIHYRAPENENFASHVDISLMSDEEDYLFVPHNYGVSLAQLNSNMETSSVFHMCFFDASNINYVREALSTAALVLDSFAARAVSLLHSSGGEKFDFSMSRRASESFMTYGNYLTPIKSTTSGGDSLAMSQNKPRNRDRTKGGSSSFREWQDSIKWNTMVMSLTLPQPTTPEVKQIGRSNMVVEWESDYFPAQEWTSDISGGMSSGFNLTVCEISSVESVLLSDASSKLDSVATGCSVVSYPSNSFNRIAASDSKSGSGNSVVYRTTVGELSPNTSYAFRLSLYYESSGGHPSQWSGRATTLPLAVPSPIPEVVARASTSDPTSAYVEFERPADDGGSAILGYHVFARHTEAHLHHTKWVWHSASLGDFMGSEDHNKIRITVSHLLPNSIYEFRIISFNERGNSSMSSTSMSITTRDARAGGLVPEIYGVAHAHRNCEVDSRPSPETWVTVDDDAQTITVFSKGRQVSKYEVWDCYWSPRLFRVSADVTWAVPILADRVAAFSDDSEFSLSTTHGKILVAQRGSVPIAVKALNLQKSGALAAIILDDERGFCASFDQRCMAGADKSNGERFALHDHPSAWTNLKIPVLLLKSSDTDSFLVSVGLQSKSAMRTTPDKSEL